MAARIAAVAALGAAIVLVALIVLNGNSSYTIHLQFQDAGGLVTGDDVLIGPARVGTVNSISLAPNSLANVVIGLHSDAEPMHQGTVARIYESSLSGIANKYVVLEPGPNEAPAIHSGGLIGTADTHTEVGLDQLFDTLDAPTRHGLSGFIRGQATAIEGKAIQGNKTLHYFAPGLESTTRVTRQLAQDEPAFNGLLSDGAKALSALASRSAELTQLIQNTNATTGAIASQNQALATALGLLPGALNHSTKTFAGLDLTLDALTPLVDKSIPASRHLTEFTKALGTFTVTSIPTLRDLVALINNPSGSGDLTDLLLQTPALEKTAAAAFPVLIKTMNDTQQQLDFFREYTPDIAAAVTNLGQAGGYYDANGHYVRTQPYFNAFTAAVGNQLAPLPSFESRYTGLQVVHGRCPGGAVQPAPDGSAPEAVPGCNPATTPPGP